MVQICKITKIVAFFLTCTIISQLYGQNYYNNPNIYYNMDTVGCIYRGKEYLDTVNKNFVLAQGYVSKYNRTLFMESTILPIIEILDTSITQTIVARIAEAFKDVHLMFPDTSGIFVSIDFSENKLDDKKLDVYITAESNYYFYDVFHCAWDDSYFEWLGYHVHTNIGCFFYGDVLCIVRLCNPINLSKVQCLYRETEEKITINVYQKIAEIIEIDQYPSSTRMTYPVCEDIKKR